MLLSVVSGTFNRLPYLQCMMESVRAQMPRHVSYEFVLVDGGSSDGTLEWLLPQTDVTLIRHGKLKGAIKSFCEGAQAAKGEYVVMANDDVEFHPNSLLRAISHLEESPACGGVAFADNRYAQAVDENAGYRTETMPALMVDGSPSSVIYAQIGMFRRLLGQKAGWWGANDKYMGKARTYGGDNYLSSRIWEMGYSIDAVDGCKVDDLIVKDTLRTDNSSKHYNDSEHYYHRFPRGPKLPPAPAVPNPQPERLRILVMPIYEPAFPAPMNLEYGLSEALASVGLTWEIDYVNQPFDLPKAVWAWQPHILLTQIHAGGREIRPEMLRKAREMKPDMVVVNWNGDAHEKGLVSPEILEILNEVHLQTVTNAKALEVYKRHNLRAAYWQIGYKDPVKPLPEVPSHDVLFLGNCYDERRQQLVSVLRQFSVGIYGSCPGSLGNTHYDWAASRALYQNCKIAVGDTFPGTIAFVSNRFFQALAGGAFLLQEHSPGLDEFNGMASGEHYVEWRSLEELAALIQEWLLPQNEGRRQEIAKAGQAFVRQNFSYDAQVEKLWGLLP